MNTKAGRNDPCPCGSGKKYKQCCWGKEEQKTYTSSGKRKFKAVMLTASAQGQYIFEQSASTQKIPDVLPEPGSLLKFRRTSKDYQVKPDQEESSFALEEPFTEPAATQEEKKDLDLPFEPTQKDFQKKEKE